MPANRGGLVIKTTARPKAIGAFTAVAAAMLAFGDQPPAQAETRIIGRFNNWILYAHEGGQAQICFAAAQPMTTEPSGARREPIFFYITAWPKDGVRSEVSVKIGYRFKSSSAVTVTVGASRFNMFTVEDRAFVADPTEELKFVEAMKKAPAMVVQGVSERGTATRDMYSLSGLAQAIQALAAGCP